MNLLFWMLYVPVVLGLMAIAAAVSWVFAYFLRQEIAADAAFVPPAVTPQQVLDGAECSARTRELLALTESSPMKSRQPLIYRVH